MNAAKTPSHSPMPSQRASAPFLQKLDNQPLRNLLPAFRMNTYKKRACNPCRMNTCKSLDLKSLCFQHLQESGEGVGSFGTSNSKCSCSLGWTKIRRAMPEKSRRRNRLRENNPNRHENRAASRSVGNGNFQPRPFRIFIPAPERNPAFGQI